VQSRPYREGPSRVVFANAVVLLGRSILRNQGPNQAQERLMLGALPSSTQEFAYVDIGRLAA